MLTGDLHHYSHYNNDDKTDGEKTHFITAGGGGAFLHLTHTLPNELDKLEEKKIILKKCFTSKDESHRFLRQNIFLIFIIGILYHESFTKTEYFWA